jgi:hypothetical protein
MALPGPSLLGATGTSVHRRPPPTNTTGPNDGSGAGPPSHGHRRGPTTRRRRRLRRGPLVVAVVAALLAALAAFVVLVGRDGPNGWTGPTASTSSLSSSSTAKAARVPGKDVSLSFTESIPPVAGGAGRKGDAPEAGPKSLEWGGAAGDRGGGRKNINNNDRVNQRSAPEHGAAAVSTGDGWKRLKLDRGGGAAGGNDDGGDHGPSSFLVGRSCRWIAHGADDEDDAQAGGSISYYLGVLLTHLFFASRKSFLGEWVCRDCGGDDGDGRATIHGVDNKMAGAAAAATTATQLRQQPPYAKWNDCPLLSRRGKCASFAFQGWDGPEPRSASYYDPTSSSPYPVRVITSYGVGRVRKVRYEQPQCPGGLAYPCFDIGRCLQQQHQQHPGTGGGGGGRPQQQQQALLDPLPIYAYPGRARVDLEELVAYDTRTNNESSSNTTTYKNEHGRFLDSFVIVDDPNRACILLLHSDDVGSVRTTVPHPSWNHGRNHYVYGVTRPIDETVHYGYAALGSVVLTDAQIRWGYDIALPLPALWSHDDGPHHHPHQTVSTTATADSDDETPLLRDVHRPRRWLLSFKGSIQDTVQPYYQHRWLAAEYWHGEPDVEIDVQCKHKTLWGGLLTYADYDHPDKGGVAAGSGGPPSHFDDVMANTTFAYCPGGSHVTSFRFSEVLSAGSIPVLPPEVVTPFAPEADWSGCVVRVSQARIVDLPRRLRNMPANEVQARQKECRRLYRLFFPSSSEMSNNNYNNSRTGAGDTTASRREERTRIQNLGFLRTALEVWSLRLRRQVYSNNQDSAAFG